MKSEWPTVTVEEVTEKIAMGPFGSNIKVSTFVGSGIPVVSGKHLSGFQLEDCGYNFITEEHADKLKNSNVFRGDVVFTHAGNIGQVAVIPESSEYTRYVLSQRQFYARPDRSKVLPDFLALYFTSPEGQHKLLMNASQVGVPSIARPSSHLKSIEFNLPPLGLQAEICTTIFSIQQKIDNNRALAADLEAMARAIFKSWFVDFDPVKDKMEGRAPAGMDADTAALFPDELVESEVGLIPKGWNVGTLADVAELNPESWSARNHPETIRYADLAGTDRGHIVKYNDLQWADAPSRARRVLRPMDTIVGTVRPANRAYAYIGEDGFTGSTGFAVLRPKSMRGASYVYIAATANEAIDRLANLADGAAYPAVRPDVVAATPALIPTEDVLEAFSALTQSCLDRMAVTQMESNELARLRDAILPRLISGKLRLPETAKMLEVI